MGIVPPFVPQNKFMMKQRARFSTLSNEFQWKLITTKNEGKSLELGGKGEGALFAGTNYYIRQICFSACEKVGEDGGRVRGQKMRTHTIEFLRGMSEFAELDQPVEYRQKKKNNNQDKTRIEVI